jgi:protein tyrosine kinase modulator
MRFKPRNGDNQVEQAQYGLQDYVAILKRRRWQFFLPVLILFIIAALAAFLWPPTYQSSSTILIEEPDVPRDLVSSTVTSYADQRIQVITQRVMTTQNLIGIINKFGLYAKERQRQPINLIVQAMRDDIELDLLSADVVDPRSGRPTQATIAFTLSFLDRQPATAQRVLNELVSLYLSENLRTRREQAAETTEFLTSESAKLEALVNELESELAEFKRENAGRLPEQAALNLQLMDRTEREMIEVRRQLQSLNERQIYLEAELAQTNPYDSYLVDGQRVLSPAERLRALQTQFISLQGIYGPRHPDVLKLAREIKALKQETGARTDPAELTLQLNARQTELGVAREKYSDGHPDVVRLQRQIAAIRTALKTAESEPTPDINITKAQPDNPSYIQLKTQLEVVNSLHRAAVAKQAALKAKLDDFEERIAAAPQIEQAYRLLQRDYETSLANYREVRAKETAAQLGQALETERKSERFSLIEPPDLPVEPVRPNRLAILVLGFVFSIAAGVGSVALFENLDQSIYGPKQLATVTGVPPLVVVPHIKNASDTRLAWTRAGLSVASVAVVVVGGLYVVQEYVIPLDVLWSLAERRFADYLGRFGGA